MNPNKALWEKGDFTQIAAFIRESEAHFVDSLQVSKSAKVLDLGCGDGSTAIPLARTGAEVLGVDIASNLVEAGKKRASEQELSNLSFQEGDACNLEGIADNSFDLTVSAFGAMFAPKPSDVAREMVRVTKPGGRIMMANWIPNDPTSFISRLLKISASFLPPPPEGFVSPVTWGVESHIVERFGQAGVLEKNISMVRDSLTFSSPSQTPAEFVQVFKNYYGPTMNAFEAAEKDGKVNELQSQILELARAQNRATDGGTFITATFLRVTVDL